MRKYINIISENTNSNVYYHGTSSEKAAKSIIKNGLIPQSHKDMGRTGKKSLDPVADMTYMTPNLRYAIIYALGANMLGKKLPNHLIKDRYGYIFVIPENTISHRQPDEDEVGHAIRESYECLYTNKQHSRNMDNQQFGDNLFKRRDIMEALVSVANKFLTPLQKEKLFKGYEYDILAVAGKKILKVMPEYLRKELVDMGCHVSSSDKIIKPSEVWRFDKNKSELLDYHGSNFFELAQQVKINISESVFYHITSEHNIDSILHNGLSPVLGPRTKLLNDAKAIYLFPDLISAEDSMNWLPDYFDDDERLVLLKIDTDGLRINKTNDSEYYTFDDINPNRISIENTNF